MLKDKDFFYIYDLELDQFNLCEIRSKTQTEEQNNSVEDSKNEQDEEDKQQ